jgi:hypothetical protein
VRHVFYLTKRSRHVLDARIVHVNVHVTVLAA